MTVNLAQIWVYTVIVTLIGLVFGIKIGER